MLVLEGFIGKSVWKNPPHWRRSTTPKIITRILDYHHRQDRLLVERCSLFANKKNAQRNRISKTDWLSFDVSQRWRSFILLVFCGRAVCLFALQGLLGGVMLYRVVWKYVRWNHLHVFVHFAFHGLFSSSFLTFLNIHYKFLDFTVLSTILILK